jgi:chromosome segregation ATPase
MAMPLLTRLFRGKGDAHAAEEEIMLADFDLHPATMIDVTPGAAKPPLATVLAEPARQAGQSELKSAVETLAAGMVEAWNGAVRDMQGILAADHARLEAAAAEMQRVTTELGHVTEELIQLRRRLAGLEGSVDDLREAETALGVRLDAQAGALRELHSTTEAQAARSRDVVAAVKKLGESLAG